MLSVRWIKSLDPQEAALRAVEQKASRRAEEAKAAHQQMISAKEADRSNRERNDRRGSLGYLQLARQNLSSADVWATCHSQQRRTWKFFFPVLSTLQ